MKNKTVSDISINIDGQSALALFGDRSSFSNSESFLAERSFQSHNKAAVLLSCGVPSSFALASWSTAKRDESQRPDDTL